MATEVEQPAVNGSEKLETIENVTVEQPAPESESAPEKEPESSPVAPAANGEELKKQKSALRFRMPKNLRNLFAKKPDATQNGENGQLNGHHENGQNGHSEAPEEAKDAVSIGCAGKMRNVFKKVKPGHVDKRPIDKTEENAKQGNDESKKEKLEAMVKNNLLGAGLADRAAVCTQDGLIAANSCEFHPSAEQVKDLVKLIGAKSEDAVGKSLKVAEVDYVCAESVEGTSLLGKHQPKVEDDSTPANGEAVVESFVFVQLAQTHVVIAAYSAAQRSITHADDLKAAMNEITKTLRDDGL